MNMRFDWTLISEEKPLSDVEVLVCCYEGINDEGMEEYMYHVAKYFATGDTIGFKLNKDIENKETRLLDAIFSKQNLILAKKDGFYIFSDASECYIELLDVVTAWVKL